EQDKIETEYAELKIKIADLEDILGSEIRVSNIIREEHTDIKERYGDERRTDFGAAAQDMNIEDLIEEHPVAILFTNKGLVKRMPLGIFRSQLRGGRGVTGMSTRDEDYIEQILTTSTHDYLLMFTSKGKVHKIKAHQIPESSRLSKGVSLAHFLSLDEGETVTTAIPVKDFEAENEYLFMTTQKGVVKKTEVSAFKHFKTRAIISINLDDGDTLKWVRKTDGNQHVILTTTAGMIIRFEESLVRPMGRASRGVKGIKIKPEDSLISMGLVDPEDEKTFIVLLTSKGYGKNIKVDEFKAQGRGGIGVKALKFRKTVPGDKIMDGVIATRDDEVMIVTQKGIINRQKITNISVQKRQSQGVRILKLDGDDIVIAMAKVLDESEFESADVDVLPEEKPGETKAPEQPPLV
ncbi:DNA gyrase subunit A, partial [bacterium]|nr:DNA gyrase subunit A [bacterium]